MSVGPTDLPPSCPVDHQNHEILCQLILRVLIISLSPRSNSPETHLFSGEAERREVSGGNIKVVLE